MKCCIAVFRTAHHSRRRGGVFVMLLVILTISLGLAGVWMQSIIRENRRMTDKLWRVQATRLAEAGVQRAVARYESDSKFEGETWLIPADQLDGKHAAKVQIRVTANEADQSTQYQATAEYPAGATHRTQITERATVTGSSEAAGSLNPSN